MSPVEQALSTFDDGVPEQWMPWGITTPNNLSEFSHTQCASTACFLRGPSLLHASKITQCPHQTCVLQPSSGPGQICARHAFPVLRVNTIVPAHCRQVCRVCSMLSRGMLDCAQDHACLNLVFFTEWETLLSMGGRVFGTWSWNGLDTRGRAPHKHHCRT